MSSDTNIPKDEERKKKKKTHNRPKKVKCQPT